MSVLLQGSSFYFPAVGLTRRTRLTLTVERRLVRDGAPVRREGTTTEEVRHKEELRLHGDLRQGGVSVPPLPGVV
jgi:hypothetical protein